MTLSASPTDRFESSVELRNNVTAWAGFLSGRTLRGRHFWFRIFGATYFERFIAGRVVGPETQPCDLRFTHREFDDGHCNPIFTFHRSDLLTLRRESRHVAASCAHSVLIACLV